VQALSHSASFRGMILEAPNSELETPAGLVLDSLREVILAQHEPTSEPIDPCVLFGALHEFGGHSETDDRRIFVFGRPDDANIALGVLFNAIFSAIDERTGFVDLVGIRIGREVFMRRKCSLCGINVDSTLPLWLHRLELFGLNRETHFEDILHAYMTSEHELYCDSCGGGTIHRSGMSFGDSPLLSFFLNRYLEGGEGRLETSIVLPL
jgi:hypothetical protein